MRCSLGEVPTTIAVIGAAGNVGGAVLRHLVRQGAAVRALARSEVSAARLGRLGTVAVVRGDFRDRGDLERLLRGAAAVFHVAPPFMEDEAAVGRRVVAATRKAGVRRIVYCSVMHPQLRRLRHHTRKLRVEEAVIESGLDFALLQPAMLMQNLGVVWPAVLSGVYPLFFEPKRRFGLVDLEDLGEAGARLLTEAGHGGVVVEAIGQPPLSFEDIAALLAEALDRPVQAQRLGPGAGREFALAQGWTDDAVRAFTAMCEYYDRHGLPGGNPSGLAALLRRPPADYRAFLRRFLSESAAAPARE